VGDVNNDGDYEVIGIGWEGASAGKLVIYDPVMNTRSLQPDGESDGGVPWKKLFRRELPFGPGIVGAGDLDVNIPGDEVIYTTEINDFASTLVVIKGDNPTPDGTGWLDHIVVNYDFTWATVDVGQVDGEGTEEVVLTDSSVIGDIKSQIAAYRVDDGGLANDSPFYDNNSSSNTWQGAVIGPVVEGGTDDVAAIRKTGPEGLPNVFIFQYDIEKGLAEDDDDALFFFPRPSRVFLANINGEVNGVRDDEIVLLRSSPNGPRLFIVNRGNDDVDSARTELELDADNGWQHGAGGDIDGDGKDEIIIMRENKIRIYHYVPTGDDHLEQLLPDTDVPTNDESIRAANLDTNGWIAGVELMPTITGPVGGVAAGSTGTWIIDLESGGEPVNFTARLEQTPTWVTRFNVSSSTTPAQISVTVDAADLMPGTYDLNVIVTAPGQDVINEPLTIPLAIEVAPAAVTVSPASAGFVYFPCAAPFEANSQQLTIGGTSGISYTAAIMDVPTVTAAQERLAGSVTGGQLDARGELRLHDGFGNETRLRVPLRGEMSASDAADIDWPSGLAWVSASSASGQIGDTLTVTVDPSQLADDTVTQQAMLVIMADARAGDTPDNIRFVPISYLCAQTSISLPITPRPDVVQ